jgi:hypothetical protein
MKTFAIFVLMQLTILCAISTSLAQGTAAAAKAESVAKD